MIAGFIGVAVFAVIANPILWVPAAAGFAAAAFLLAVGLATLATRITASWRKARTVIAQTDAELCGHQMSTQERDEVLAILRRAPLIVTCASCTAEHEENSPGVTYAWGDWWCHDEAACESRTAGQEEDADAL